MSATTTTWDAKSAATTKAHKARFERDDVNDDVNDDDDDDDVIFCAPKK